MKVLNNPKPTNVLDSKLVSLELDSNLAAAAHANAVAATNIFADQASASAAYYVAQAVAIDNLTLAKEWLKLYFKRSEENKQDYINEIKGNK